ncbi:hypothetical protein BKA56DRAFT_616564 [Ilyonectria sp. MPI-CAGE-AT-0026]|nr:hypothetical protein BKA56DRAFT_616564 [Ilyonectria sp. MPI-CAGE-AT-0026]
MDHEDRDATAGLYTFVDYFNKKRGREEWKEVEPSFEKALAAIAGFVMQAGVVVVAAVVTYRLQLKVDDKPPNDYGFLTMFTGTILLCTGNFLCAFLVGEITKERLFERQLPSDTIGFVAQFVGLRKLHPLVSVAQLGAMLVMSAIRSLLRTQRLSRKFNLLNGVSDVLQGHELDWLALHLEIDETSKCLDSKHFWPNNRLLMGSFIQDTTARDELTTKKSAFWVAGRAIELGIIIFMEGNEEIPVGDPVRIFGTRARQMYHRREIDSFFNKCPLVMSSSTALASKILAYPDIILSNTSAFWDDRWEDAVIFTWATSCHVSTGYKTEKDAFYLNLQRRTRNHACDMDVSVVEAVLGLWVMALALDPKGRTYGYDLATNSISKKSGKSSNKRYILTYTLLIINY